MNNAQTAAPKAPAKAAKKLTTKVAKAPKASSTAKAQAPAPAAPVVAAPTKYVEGAPEGSYVCRDIRGRLLPIIGEDGKARFHALTREAFHKVQYGPVYSKAGLFVTVHKNNVADGERALRNLRNLWATKNPARWTQPKDGNWSAVCDLEKTAKEDKVFAGIPEYQTA